jgi:hypothetical protein
MYGVKVKILFTGDDVIDEGKKLKDTATISRGLKSKL